MLVLVLKAPSACGPTHLVPSELLLVCVVLGAALRTLVPCSCSKESRKGQPHSLRALAAGRFMVCVWIANLSWLGLL